jgi:DNA-binding LacI/PurR family transcriptional regulator
MTRIRNIKDLAELAGVSAGTVSRALAGSTLISLKTRERIKALADEHGFRPNVLARNLRTQRTGAIGVLIPLGHETGQAISDPFFITMLGLLADLLTGRGYDLLLSRVIPADEHWLEAFTDSGRVDGVIVIGQSDQAAVLDKLAARYKPLVVWGGYNPGQVHCSVGTDNLRGGELAAAHLIERGCRRLAFFGDPHALELAQRLDGCRAAIASSGVDVELNILPAGLIADDALAEIGAFLSSGGPLPDGIVCASDVIAMSALRALADHGVAVPEQIKVIGFDGLPIGEQTVPRLSSIGQDIAAGARDMVDMLMQRIGGQETQSVVMEPVLIQRGST